jgi:DNA topoisomerase VI subunit A
MAKKQMTQSDTAATKTKAGKGGKDAAVKIVRMADQMVKYARDGTDPYLEIPIRSLTNVSFDPKRRIIEMGDAKQTRNFFNLGQAKKFMQSMLIASFCNELAGAGKTASIRQAYYSRKHTIAGTSEKTFNDQAESDPIIEDLEVSLDSLREELHIYASNRGAMVGPLVFVDSGDTIDANRLGSGGYSIPSIVEPDVIQFKKCDAKFVLHVEKDTVWRRFVEDKFAAKHKCILIHGGGQPPRGVRRLLNRFHLELKLPVYCLLDNDPWGYYIYSVVKQGSINLAYESQRMAVPDAKFLGVSSYDYERCGLTDDVKIDLDKNDIGRAKQIMKYPWFKDKKPWLREVQKMLSNGFKMEVEALINKRLTFLTEEYVPMKIKDRKQWLD